jgi:hypothetical protein
MISGEAVPNLSTIYGSASATFRCQIIASLFILALIVGLTACGSDAGQGNSKKRVATVRSVKWGVFKILNEKKARIVSEVGYCVGDQKPWIKHVKVRETSGVATILAQAAFPKQQDPKGFCAGVGLFIYRTVRFDHDLSDLRLYDARTDPPTLRWPRSSPH